MTRRTALFILRRLFSIAFGLLQEFLRLGRGLLRSRTALAAENLFLRKQLAFYQELLFAKTPARREINNIAAAISPPFCYKS